MSLATAAMPAASDDPQRTSLVAGTKAIVDLSRTTTGQTQSLFHPQPQYSTMGDLTNIRRNQSLDPKLLRSRSNSERSEATRLSDDDSAACKAGDSSADRYMEVDVERPITEGIRQYIIQGILALYIGGATLLYIIHNIIGYIAFQECIRT